MLSQSTMGVVALVILWGNTLLVALATAKQALALLNRGRDFEGAIRGRVVGGPLALHEVVQKGRLASGKAMTIVFHDCAFSSRSLGGAIETADGARFAIPAGPAEVWVTEGAAREAQRCASASAFEEAYVAARKVKGWTRSVVATIEPGAEVFVSGDIVAEAEGVPASIRPAAAGLLISTFDPSAWARGRALAALGGFIPAILAGALGCTLLAMAEPVFEGTTSKIGGIAGLVFFLLVLPAGTAVRDWLRPPARRFLRGRWEHPDPARASVPGPAEQEAAL